MNEPTERIREIDNIGSKNLILEEETYSIIGAAMDVYYRLGSGFLEPVYQEALAYEFGLRQVPFEAEKKLPITYKDHLLKKGYFADFVCYDQIIIEIKAITTLSPIEWSQIMNYLKASKPRIGLLFNFGSQGRMEMKRIVI
jgi:GxxExxY protein